MMLPETVILLRIVLKFVILYILKTLKGFSVFDFLFVNF